MDSLTTSALAGAQALLDLGGPVVAVLLALSLLGLTVALAKTIGFIAAGVWRTDPPADFWVLSADGQAAAAGALLHGRRGPIADMLADGLAAAVRADKADRMADAMEATALNRLAALGGGLGLLEFIAGVAPLLGLFGTVLGMIDAFQAMEAAGARVDPALLSGGIWVALLTTGVGLAVAMPMMAAHALLDGAVQGLSRRMEAAASRLLALWPVGIAAADRSTDATAVDPSRPAPRPGLRFGPSRAPSLGGWKEASSAVTDPPTTPPADGLVARRD